MSILKKVINEDEIEGTKEQYVVNYLKSLLTIENAIEPYREQKKDLRKEYVESGWLNRQEIWAAVKALRLYQNGVDMDDLNDMFETVERQFGGKNV